jgi:cytochrome P450
MIFYLIFSQGKDWQEARHHVNPILMQTKIVQMYGPKIDAVAEEFVNKYNKLQD